jgi:prolipoprotein diacylglyceryltransferase
MSIALIQLVLVVVGLVVFVWWIRMLIEALRTPASQWEAAGQSLIVYVLLMVLLGVIGTIVYVVVARPQLRSAGPAAAVSP